MSILKRGRTFGIQIAAPCEGAALSLHAPQEVLPRHRHDGAYICVVLAGAFLESSAGGAAKRRAGDIVLHPAGEWHDDRFDAAGGRCLNLHLPTDAIARSEVRRATSGFRVAAEDLSVQSALGPSGDRLTAESALSEMLNILFASRERNVDSPISPVLEALDDEPDREWTLSELAHLAGRHPTHLARAFRAATGVSIGEYRRRRRVAELALALRSTHESLARLAQAHGYADQAHMTRQFRRLTGCTPGAWRRRVR